jgi:hypothetical protein
VRDIYENQVANDFGCSPSKRGRASMELFALSPLWCSLVIRKPCAVFDPDLENEDTLIEAGNARLEYVLDIQRVQDIAIFCRKKE